MRDIRENSIAFRGARVGYENTWLYQRAFLLDRNDAPRSEQEYFRSRYTSMREKANLLVSRIGADMKDMTVHDISHLDALWEMASIVARDSIDLNPPEAFVFGGAVLMHDAGMTLAAYPDGLDGLKDNVVWKDSFARLVMERQEETGATIDENLIEELATSEALRKLHAVQAAKLPTIAWLASNGDSEFLIDDPEVRNFYGPKIGQIAHSHWWSVARIEEELENNLGPLGGRTENLIDLMKIASLVRVSDAMHLDRRRAPSFMQKLLNPQGVSAFHWLFQERMAVPYIEHRALVYSASSPFELASAEAWWLAFDALTMVDRELRDVDHLLQKHRSFRLSVDRVRSISSATELAQSIETDGWVPVDTIVRVSDVPKIVGTLGGRKLYGDRPEAALRELIQNAADAVDARRKLQGRDPTWGSISVTLEKSDGEYWLAIDDCGVGMSPGVLTGPLIDFGNSFWRSPFAAEEFPGIQAAGVSATGRYGIGFFSVFMLGSRVRVTSRRYDKASDSARTLEFSDGLSSRPILYVPKPDQSPIDGGTRVEVRLDRDPWKEGGILNDHFYVESRLKLRHLVAAVAPSLRVSVNVTEGKSQVTAVRPEDWLKLKEEDLCARLAGSSLKVKKKPKDTRLRTLTDSSGNIFGRAMIETASYRAEDIGCITVGGLRASNVACIRGVLLGREETAARDEAIPLAPKDVLAKWASEQAGLIENASLGGEESKRCSGPT